MSSFINSHSLHAHAAPGRHGRMPWLCMAVAAALLSTAGCDRRSESSPGSSPAAVGSGSTSSGRSDAGTASSGVETRTPAAPDIRSGGSTGPAGVAPTPDTSGGHSTASIPPGASNRQNPVPAMSNAPPNAAVSK